MGGRHEQHKRYRPEPIRGYDLTHAIRLRLAQAPHVLIESSIGRVSIVYGRKRKLGDPAFSVFCRIEDKNGFARQSAAGGVTREDALRSIGREVFDLVREHEARQRQIREEEKQRRQTSAQLRQRIVRREPVADETDPDVQEMHRTGAVPRRLRFYKADMF